MFHNCRTTKLKIYTTQYNLCIIKMMGCIFFCYDKGARFFTGKVEGGNNDN